MTSAPATASPAVAFEHRPLATAPTTSAGRRVDGPKPLGEPPSSTGRGRAKVSLGRASCLRIIDRAAADRQVA